jgi:hypothetical protein
VDVRSGVSGIADIAVLLKLIPQSVWGNAGKNVAQTMSAPRLFTT